jgi:hypothetical protein
MTGVFLTEIQLTGDFSTDFAFQVEESRIPGDIPLFVPL